MMLLNIGALVDALRYLTLTRPNIVFPVAVSKVYQCLHAPTIIGLLCEENFEVLTKIELKIGKSKSLLSSAFSYANWARCLHGRRSTYVFFPIFESTETGYGVQVEY
jgi:hypothetical protein